MKAGEKIYHTDRFIPQSEFRISIQNRSFRFGDGLFETIFISDSRPLYLPFHIDRLHLGMQLLQLNKPAGWTVEFFREIITRLAFQNNFINARCRITVWRAGEGTYQPLHDEAEMLIELYEMDSPDYHLNQTGFNLGVYSGMPKLIHPLSACKTANALVYVLAAKFAAKEKLDNVIVLNNAGRVADAVGSNIFIFRDRKLFTPAMDEGGVNGVMSKIVTGLCRMEGIEVNEIKMEPDELKNAGEVFLTNTILGISWVGSFGNFKFSHHFIDDLTYILNEQKYSDTLVSP